jgi:hypothetical protein
MNVIQAKKGWSTRQKLEWRDAMQRKAKRNYGQDIVSRLRRLPANTHTIEKYGSLRFNSARYPLFNVTIGDLKNGRPNVLITGGVHGYEPSGIEACLKFIEHDAPDLTNAFNFVVYPCISPWAYEYDHRWNAYAEDPNRNFSRDSGIVQIDECTHFMNAIEGHGSRFGTELEEYWQSVPQGAYLMMTKPTSSCLGHRAKFASSIMHSIGQVSPIAPEENLLGYHNNNGVIWAPNKGNVLRVYLGGHADQVAVTEVYPDHKDVGPERAVDVQRAAIYGALNHVYS